MRGKDSVCVRTILQEQLEVVGDSGMLEKSHSCHKTPGTGRAQQTYNNKPLYYTHNYKLKGLKAHLLVLKLHIVYVSQLNLTQI